MVGLSIIDGRSSKINGPRKLLELTATATAAIVVAAPLFHPPTQDRPAGQRPSTAPFEQDPNPILQITSARE
jgi:hypothetical protein